jgi:hypothetical protein
MGGTNPLLPAHRIPYDNPLVGYVSPPYTYGTIG